MIDIIRKIMADYLSESDRACAILIASHFEVTLEEILKKYFVPIKSNTDELIDGYGPLGTFSAKIDISYRLGLISKKFSNDLHLVRKIRNHYAHNIGIISFDDDPIRSWVDSIYKSVGVLVSNKAIKEIPHPATRIRYIIALSFMLVNLISIKENCKTVNSSTENNEVYTFQEKIIGKQVQLHDGIWTIERAAPDEE